MVMSSDAWRRYRRSILGGFTLLALLCLPVLNDPLLLDEAIFAGTMRSVAETGDFRYYAGIARGWQPGLWHPPTYISYVAGWFGVFGASSLVARTATVLFSLLTVPALAFLAAQLATRTVPGDERTVVAGSIGFYITSPLVIQNATLVDIDGSLLALVVTLFVAWTVTTLEGDQSDRRLYGGTTVWFAALSWVKFGALPVLLVCLVGYVTLKQGRRQGGGVGVAAVIGFAGFVLSWGVVAWLFDLSVITPFAHNFGSLLDGGSGTGTGKRILLSAWTAYLEVLWLSPFLGALALLAAADGQGPTTGSIFERVQKTLTDRALLLFPLTISLLTLFQYALLAKAPYGFPKYLGIATPLLCAVAATWLPRVRDATRTGRKRHLLGALVLVAATVIVLLGDPFLVSFNDGYGTVVMQSATTLTGLLVSTLFVGGVLAYRLRPIDHRSLLAVGLVILLVGTNLGVLAVQVSADYSTRYNYGQRGTETVIAETQTAYTSLPEGERSSAVLPRDFAFYVDGEFHIVREYSAAEWRRERPPLVVIRTRKYYAVDSPLLDELRDTEGYRAQTYGSYVMFQRIKIPEESASPVEDWHVSGPA